MSERLTDREKSFIRLLLRSPDLGDGWRKVSATVWPLVEGFDRPELVELEQSSSRVRLTPRGQIVAEYLV